MIDIFEDGTEILPLMPRPGAHKILLRLREPTLEAEPSIFKPQTSGVRDRASIHTFELLNCTFCESAGPLISEPFSCPIADCTPDYEDGIDTIRLDMYEAGGEEGSGFHVFNVASDQYHRAEVLQQTGAIDVTCRLEKVIHGAMSADSDRYATLVVLQWFFQPHNRRRISEAFIELLFEAEDSGSGDDIEVERISFDGTYSLMPTTQQESLTTGGDASVAINQLASFSLSGKWEKVINRQTWDAITLTGGKRVVNNRPPNRIAKWVLSENKSQPKGIPATLKVGVLVSRSEEKRFTCRVAFACKTDMKTTAESFFKKIPRDDPIVFQPDIHDKGTRPNKSVSYGDDRLGSVNLDEVGDVTFRTIITRGEKTLS